MSGFPTDTTKTSCEICDIYSKLMNDAKRKYFSDFIKEYKSNSERLFCSEIELFNDHVLFRSVTTSQGSLLSS